MGNYNDAVAEARQLVKRSEADQWRLAELTWQQVDAGKSRRQWAQDIGRDPRYISRIYLVWERWGEVRVPQRPPFHEAFNAFANRPEQAEDESKYVAQARRAIRNMPPEKKAEVVKELLDEPRARAAAGRVLDEHYDRDRALRQRETPIPAPSEHDHTVEVLVRLRAISAAIKAATDVIQAGPSLGNTTGDLRAIVAWQRNALDILDAVLSGRTDMDAELAAILEEG